MKKIKLSVAKFFIRIGMFFKEIFTPLIKGKIFTKINFLVLGTGNVAHKQYIKGLIYFCFEVMFFTLMFSNPTINSTPIGFKAIKNLATLGTVEGGVSQWNPVTMTFESIQPDNSMLMLLYGVVTLGIIAGFILLYFSAQKSVAKADAAVSEGKKPTTFVEDLKTLLDEKFHATLLVPALIGIILFTVLPTIFMVLIAFTNYDKDHVQNKLIDWVGLQNFISVFSGNGNFSEIHSRFLPVLGWTAVWAVFATLLNYFGGIFLAILINNKNVKCKALWRTIFIMTIAIPQFISLLAIRMLTSKYGPLGSNGALHGFWKAIGIEGDLFGQYNNANLVRTAIIIVNMWIGIPYTMLMTSGILMNVPKDLYEAAEIDGASKFTMFRKITFPYIIFITTPYLIQSFIGNITSFNVIFLLSGGNPVAPGGYIAGKTDLLVTWLYKLTIDQQQYNLGAVIGIFTFLITASITLISYRRSKAYKEEDTFQ